MFPKPGALSHNSLLTFALRRLRASVVFLVSSEAIQRKLMRVALQVPSLCTPSPKLSSIVFDGIHWMLLVLRCFHQRIK